MGTYTCKERGCIRLAYALTETGLGKDTLAEVASRLDGILQTAAEVFGFLEWPGEEADAARYAEAVGCLQHVLREASGDPHASPLYCEPISPGGIDKCCGPGKIREAGGIR